MKLAAIISLVFATTLALPVTAQDVVGTTVMGGKRVELLSDRTWRFAEVPENQGTCVPINNFLSFCGTILDWRPTKIPNSDFIRVFATHPETYAGIIHEELGIEDGMTLEFMRNSVIEYAADATGVRPEEIPITGVETTEVDGLPAETVSYSLQVSTLTFHYHNTIVTSPTNTFQFAVWAAGKTPPDNFKEISDAFLSHMRLSLPEATE